MNRPTMFRAKGDGIEIQVAEWPGEGRPVLAVHGLTANCLSFSPLAKSLSPRHRLLAVDLRGRGRSDQPDHGYSIDHHCRDLTAVLDDLGLDQVVLMGHSLGAYICLALAGRIPSRVKGLIMLDAGARLSLDDWGRIGEAIKPSLDRLEQSFPSFEAFTEVLKLAPFLQPWTQDLDDYFRYDVEEVDGRVRSRVKPEHVREERNSLLAVDIAEWYPPVTCPVLVLRAGSGVFSDQDLLIPPHAVAPLQEDLPQARIITLEKANHYSIALQADKDRDRAVLEFLEEIG